MRDEIGAARPRVPKALGWVLLASFVLPVAVAAVSVAISGSPPRPKAGVLVESERKWRPEDGKLPDIAEVTRRLGLHDWMESGTREVSGGAAIVDVDGDGSTDVVVGGGSGGVFFGSTSGFEYIKLEPGSIDVTGVAAGDVDGDGTTDVLFATAGDVDVVHWGDDWSAVRRGSQSSKTSLMGGGPSTGLLLAALDADPELEVLRLGYGPDAMATPDVIWDLVGPREFSAIVLPDSRRRSLAAEIVDLEGDGTPEIWVTRDVGWRAGADSLYRLDDRGQWRDVAASMGTDLEVDGMGVTVADFTGDGVLDAYISDVGDNELLLGLGGSFAPRRDVGVARIRPGSSSEDVISSSWATGAADLNLDGRLDIVVANGGFGSDADIANKVVGTRIVYDDPPGLLMARSDGTFADVWADLGLPWAGAARGLSIGDIDDDGDADMVFVVRGVGLRVFENRLDSPALTVRSICPGAGQAVTIRSDLGRTVALAAPHAFLGAHQATLIVGVEGRSSVEAGRGVRRVGVVEGRHSVDVGCSPD